VGEVGRGAPFFVLLRFRSFGIIYFSFVDCKEAQFMERVINVAWKKWRLIFAKDLPRDTEGTTDPPTKKRKAIRIKSETHHAGNDTINEDYVAQIAEDQAAAFCHADCLGRFLSCPKIVNIVQNILDSQS
jgi:hypothetical protein